MSDQIEDLLRKKSDLDRRRERLLGKLDSAKESLKSVHQELEVLGIAPDQIEAEIERLAQERERKLIEYNNTLTEAEEVLSRIEERLNNL